MHSKKTQFPVVMHTKIEDMKISSVLDKGFFGGFETSPEMHSHSFFELLFALEGDLRIQLLNGRLLSIPPKSFCLILPTVYHSTHISENHEKKLALGFQIEKSDTSSRHSFYELCVKKLQSDLNEPLIFECEELYEALQAFNREFNSSLPASEPYASALLLQCYVLLFRALCGRLEAIDEDESAEAADLSVSRKVLIDDYLYHHSGEPITQEDLAAFLNLSTRQLNRILQQLYGTSFRQRLIDVRLHKAAQLLTTTERAIDDIALSVGYTSLSGFYSAFHSKFGISAGKRRKISRLTGRT